MRARTKPIRVWWLAIAVAVVVATLAAAPPAGARDAGEPPAATGTPVTLDQRLLAVAELAPEFGGMYADAERDVLHVNLTDEKAAEGVLTAIVEVFDPEHLPGRGAEIELHLVESNLEVPLRSHWAASHDLLHRDGFVSSDYDEATNQVVVGVADAAAAAEAEAYFAERGLRREMVRVEIVEAFTEHDLDQPHDSKVGGLRIRRGPASMGWCTLGFNADALGWSGFVTNSHCTAVTGSLESSLFWQAAQPNCTGFLCGFPHGIEIADPPYQPALYDVFGCPAGRACRFSDSAFVRYTVPSVSGGHRIAGPSAFNTLGWNGADTFDVAFGADAFVNSAVQKVGATTGRTLGFVTATCASVNASNPDGTDTGRTNLCQNLAIYSSQGGDSGSPVFTPWYKGTAILRGLNWGGNGTVAAFSPVSSVVAELGLADY